MPARVLAVILAIALPAQPQCNFTPVLSDQFRSSILDLAVEGNDLWAATSYGLALYDRSVDPPRLVASLPVAGATRMVRLSNGLAYAGSGNAIAVVRKNGRALQLTRTIDAGAPINDLVVTTLALYVATRNGLAQFSVIEPTTTFSITQAPATSLTTIGSSLYAAHGDTSIDVFNISIPSAPQRIGTITAPANITTLHANNGKLFAASAVGTYVFLGSTSTQIGSAPFSIVSLAPISGDAIFAGSNDRTLRGIDFTTPGTPADIFRDELPPSGGTVNRINAMATAGGRLYVGAGDIGIAAYDISAYNAPYPMRSLALSGASSVFSAGSTFYVGRTNGVTEFTQSSSTVTQARSWDGSRSDVVQDGADGLLLTSSGSSMTLWALASQIPAVVATATFRAPVVGAALIGTIGYAVLSDRTVWSADFSQPSPVPQAFPTGNIQPVSIARSAGSIAVADTRSDGTTMVAFYPNADFHAAPLTVTVPGLATGAVTFSNTTVAIQTFRGISLIDFSGKVTTLPQSNTEIARQLVLSGITLLELTDTSVRVWNTQTQSVTAEVELPASPMAIHIAPLATTADVVTSSGAVVIALDRLSQMPLAINAPNGSAFYKKIVASPTRIALADARGVDIYTNALHYVGSIRAGGIVDVAASDSGIFTLSANLTVTAYTLDGVLRSTTTISEGSDVQAQSIATANGAVWASIVRGCLTGACEKKTLVFDPILNQTASMTGAAIDVVTSGSLAYAVTDLPAEVRVINVTDAMHPAIISSRAVEGTPASIAYSSGALYVLGNTLNAYTEAGLTKGADLLGPYSSDGTVTSVDQHVRIDGNCAIVTGRSFAPQLFTLPQWTPVSSFSSPSAGRMLAAQPGTFYILTDHSLEIWSTGPLPKPPRRAPAR